MEKSAEYYMPCSDVKPNSKISGKLLEKTNVSVSLRPLNWLEQAPTDRPARNLIVDMWEGGSQTGLVRSYLSLVVWKAEVIAKAVSP